MKKCFNLRIGDELKGKLEQIARSEKRSLNQQIEKVLEDFVDNNEIKPNRETDVGGVAEQ